MSEFRFADDLARKHLYDLLGDVQAQSNAFGIELLRGLQESKKLEQFDFIIFTDACSCILHLNFKESLVMVLRYYILKDALFNRKIFRCNYNFRYYFYKSAERSKFNRIGNQV